MYQCLSCNSTKILCKKVMSLILTASFIQNTFDRWDEEYDMNMNRNKTKFIVSWYQYYTEWNKMSVNLMH